MAAHGVDTLFLETGNSGQASDVVRPAQLGRLVDAAHDAGLRVVAWYLPTLLYPPRDLRRVLAAVRFTSPMGGRFDSFALDIEASDVRTVSLRNARLVALSAALRAAVGPGVSARRDRALGGRHGAPPEVLARASRTRALRPLRRRLPADGVLHVPGARAAAPSARYVMRSVALLRAGAGADVPVHVIGGIASSASSADDAAGSWTRSPAAARSGYSLYDFPITSERHLEGARVAAAGAGFSGRVLRAADSLSTLAGCPRSPGAVADAFAERVREQEEQTLSPLAVRSYETRGRGRPEERVRACARPSSATATGSSTRRRSGA